MKKEEFIEFLKKMNIEYDDEIMGCRYIFGIVRDCDSSIVNLQLNYGFKIEEVDMSDKFITFLVAKGIISTFDWYNNHAGKIYLIIKKESCTKLESEYNKLSQGVDYFNYFETIQMTLNLYFKCSVNIIKMFDIFISNGIYTSYSFKENLEYENKDDGVSINDDIIEHIKNKLDFKIFKTENLLPAFEFFKQSYTSKYLPMAFVGLISALEYLFLNTNTELSYKLSRNVSVFLANTSEEFETLFTQIKNYYDLRSTFLHSGKIKTSKVIIDKKELNELREIVRRCLLKIIEKNDEFNKDKLIKELNRKGF